MLHSKNRLDPPPLRTLFFAEDIRKTTSVGCLLSEIFWTEKKNSWIFTVGKFPVLDPFFHNELHRPPIPYKYSWTKKILIENEFFELKELRNCILCVSRVWSLFYSIRVCLGLSFLPWRYNTKLHVSTYCFGKLVLVVSLCFLCLLLVLCFEFNATISIIIVHISATCSVIFFTLLIIKT